MNPATNWMMGSASDPSLRAIFAACPIVSVTLIAVLAQVSLIWDYEPQLFLAADSWLLVELIAVAVKDTADAISLGGA